MTQPAPKKSDLGVRAASAVVMVAVAGTALWLGGWVWTVFVAAVALGVLWEWQRLTSRFALAMEARVGWALLGVLYVGIATATLLFLRNAPSLEHKGAALVLMIVGPVIATDVGAYFAGRAIGGPKIAPSISPSKTWAGLLGGMFFAGLAISLMTQVLGDGSVAFVYLPAYFVAGALIAVVAQAGDFFESWLKRRAGLKDSGNMIPGHGGLFDRVDGLLAVMFVVGLIGLLSGQ